MKTIKKTKKPVGRPAKTKKPAAMKTKKPVMRPAKTKKPAAKTKKPAAKTKKPVMRKPSALALVVSSSSLCNFSFLERRVAAIEENQNVLERAMQWLEGEFDNVRAAAMPVPRRRSDSNDNDSWAASDTQPYPILEEVN